MFVELNLVVRTGDRLNVLLELGVETRWLMVFDLVVILYPRSIE